MPIVAISSETWETMAEEEITVTNSTPIGFTTSILEPTTLQGKGAKPDIAVLQVTTNSIRLRFTTNPTTTVGFSVQQGEIRMVVGPNDLKSLMMIAEGANAKVFVQYGRMI